MSRESERKLEGGNSPVKEDRGPSGGWDGAIADDGNSLLEGSSDDVPDEEYSTIDWTKESLVIRYVDIERRPTTTQQ